jgi:hypothetical protein
LVVVTYFTQTNSGTELSTLGVAIRPYLEQINECVEGARREAADISTADMAPISARAQAARKVFNAPAIPACALFVGVLFDHQPYSETAIRSMANATVDVAAKRLEPICTNMKRLAG